MVLGEETCTLNNTSGEQYIITNLAAEFEKLARTRGKINTADNHVA